MATRLITVCDLCGTEKKEVNHWFLVRLMHYTDGIDMKISRYSDSKALRPGAKAICGQSCLHKIVSQTFDSQLITGDDAISSHAR
jgi:hypothetical protein